MFYFRSLLFFAGFSCVFLLPVQADEAALQRQVESLQQEKNKAEQERRDLEKKYKDELAAEKLRLRRASAQRQHADFKILLSYLREQLARYDLHLTFGGADGESIIVSPLPAAHEKLTEQGQKFADNVKQFQSLLREKQKALDEAQAYYNALSREYKEGWADTLEQAQREKDSASLALETALAAEVAINQLIHAKGKQKKK